MADRWRDAERELRGMRRALVMGPQPCQAEEASRARRRGAQDRVQGVVELRRSCELDREP